MLLPSFCWTKTIYSKHYKNSPKLSKTNLHSTSSSLFIATSTTSSLKKCLTRLFRKIIEDHIAESKNEGGTLDIVSEIAFQNHFRQLQANIEKSATLHMEFWSQLSEEQADLGKLNDIGSKINNSIQYVEEHWNQMQKINPNTPKAVRLYGRFLIEVLNNKEGGENLLQHARRMAVDNQKHKHGAFANTEDFANDPSPTVFMTTEPEKFGNITGINLAAASLFGYNKTELISLLSLLPLHE